MPDGPVTREAGRLVVRASSSRNLLAALASALFVAMGTYLCAGSLVPALFADPFASLSLRIFVFAVGALTVLFFGFVVVFLVGRLLSFRRPIFEVGPEGILDRGSALSAGFISWEEVEEASPLPQFGCLELAPIGE